MTDEECKELGWSTDAELEERDRLKKIRGDWYCRHHEIFR